MLFQYNLLTRLAYLIFFSLLPKISWLCLHGPSSLLPSTYWFFSPWLMPHCLGCYSSNACPEIAMVLTWVLKSGNVSSLSFISVRFPMALALGFLTSTVGVSLIFSFENWSNIRHWIHCRYKMNASTNLTFHIEKNYLKVEKIMPTLIFDSVGQLGFQYNCLGIIYISYHSCGWQMFFKVNVLSGRHRARQPKNRVLTPAVGLKILSRMLWLPGKHHFHHFSSEE